MREQSADTVATPVELAIDLGTWWEEVSTCALVGTGRRPVPTPPPALVEITRTVAVGSEGPDDPAVTGVGRDDDAGRASDDARDSGATAGENHVHPERRLLDQIALGAAWLGGAVEPTAADTLDPAPAETRAVAPPQAVVILELVLREALAGPGPSAGLVADWVRAATDRGLRVPARLVPAMLDHALRRSGPTSGSAPGSNTTATPADRADAAAALLAVTGERGRWLARLDPQWRALLTPTQATPSTPVGSDPAVPSERATLPEDWLQRPLPQQLALLARLRTTQRAIARAAVTEAYRSGSARERAAYLGVLADGLGDADEELLEHALSDRAAGVREEALTLLDRLPTSARAARMGERLRPLVTVSTRLFRRKVVVLLPDAPDPAGVRDGLGKPTARARSTRGHHLTQIVAGTPLALWEELTGLSPEAVLIALEDPGDVRQGLRRAAIAQRDPQWARALLVHDRLHPGLLGVLDPGEAEGFVLDRLPTATADDGGAMLTELPGPWGPELSLAALTHIMRAHGRAQAGGLLAALGERIHPSCLPSLQAAVERLPFGAERDRASRTVAVATLRQSISEAFT